MPFTGMVGAPGFGNCVTIAALCDMMEKNSRRRLGEDTFYLPRQYTNRARKPLIFLDFLKLTEKIYYLFTTY